MDSADLQEQNRRSWNMVVPVHAGHHRDLAGYLRAGGLTIFPEERELLGDLPGARLAHLMCNTGQDTLSLARLGAIATGVDLSDAAIDRARRLAQEAAIPATFVRMEALGWLRQCARDGASFDRIFCSYGAICWVADMGAWARAIAAALAPGGRFVAIDFHPVSNMFDPAWRLTQPYPQGGRQLTLPGVGDYVGAAGDGLAPSGFVPDAGTFQNPEPCHLFQWSVGEVVSALAEAGLVIEALREYTYVNGERPFDQMAALPGRRLAAPPGVPSIPLMYAVAARRSQ